jgi:hypothetical protein
LQGYDKLFLGFKFGSKEERKYDFRDRESLTRKRE